MAEEENKNSNVGWLTTHRIESLTDGIFAFAMTLLVLNITIPVISNRDVSAAALENNLSTTLLYLYDYFISFMILASFWAAHHRQFHKIKRANEGLLWINIVVLMFIVLIPFTTELNSRYGSIWVAPFIFELNMIIVAFLFYFLWSYATENHRLVDPKMPLEAINRGKRRSYVLISIAFLGLVLSFIIPDWSSTVYIFLPLAFYLANRKDKEG